MFRRYVWVGLFLHCLSSFGCRSVYRAETVLYGDGRAERAIYQPRNTVPEAGRGGELWQQVIEAAEPAEIEKQGWPRTIRQLPPRAKKEGEAYFLAWGAFKSVQDLPDHLEFKVDEGAALPKGKLVRAHVRRDYGLAVEHRWRETLTDIVKLDDMQKAREELANLLIALFQDVFQQALGQDYDAADLAGWMKQEGKTWLAELSDYFFVQSAAKKGRLAQEAIVDGLAAICDKHGLKLKANGKFLDNAAMEKALVDFLTAKVTAHVTRKKDGKKVPPETVLLWLAELQKGDKDMIFRPAAERVIETKYGGQKALGGRLQTLASRILGLYYLPFPFMPAREFHYTMTMPGEVLETNGKLLALNKVLWDFDATDAYPQGYVMECRSAESKGTVQQDLLSNRPLDDRETLLEFLDLAQEDDQLPEVFKECVKQKSLKPLEEHQNKLAGSKSENKRKNVEQILKVLKRQRKEAMSRPLRRGFDLIHVGHAVS